MGKKCNKKAEWKGKKAKKDAKKQGACMQKRQKDFSKIRWSKIYKQHYTELYFQILPYIIVKLKFNYNF